MCYNQLMTTSNLHTSIKTRHYTLYTTKAQYTSYVHSMLSYVRILYSIVYINMQMYVHKQVAYHKQTCPT